MIEHISSTKRAVSTYGRQQFYADRSAKLSIKKTTQVGISDRVTLSATAPVAASHETAATALRAKSTAKDIAYDDPSKAARAKLIKSGPQTGPLGKNLPENEFMNGLPVAETG